MLYVDWDGYLCALLGIVRAPYGATIEQQVLLYYHAAISPHIHTER